MTLLVRRQIQSPLGPLLAGVVVPGATADEPGGVCLLELGDEERRGREVSELETHFGSVFLGDAAVSPGPGHAVLDRLESELGSYFAGESSGFSVPVCAPGTRFQHQVWGAMGQIPLGETVTYGQICDRIGRARTAARAVGAASGQNRVSILIPCHRVVDLAYNAEAGGTAGLRGYGGGLEKKRWLLDHERRLSGGPGLFESLLDAERR
jgi:O-6-methylguanine DNA methyltransferase